MDRGPQPKSGIMPGGLHVKRLPRSILSCCAASEIGILSILTSGDVVFDPQKDALQACGGLMECFGDKRGKVIPVSDIVGATVEGQALCVWYCRQTHTGNSSAPRSSWKLYKSELFAFDSMDQANAYAERIRMHAAWQGRLKPPRVVAIVNPVSGRGSGYRTFNQEVLPILRDAAGLEVEVHTTQGAGHATEIVKGLNLDQVDLILYVGGDGTIYEGMQGLYSRPDWERAARVPFGSVPTGSGNGMAASLGIFDAVSAAYSVCKMQTHPLDVASVLQPPRSRFFLVLSLAYGLMANLDIGTENLRWMGEPRFTVGGLKELFAQRTYPMRVAVWPASVPAPDGDELSKGSAIGAEAVALTARAPAPYDPELPLAGAGGMSAALLPDSKSHSHSAAPKHMQPAAVQAPTCLSLFPSGPPLPILNQLGSLPAHVPSDARALPEGWRTLPEQVCDQAQYFMLHNTRYIALNARVNPQGVSSDGVWDLVYASGMKGWRGFMAGIKLLLTVETGDHVKLDFMHTQQVRALMMEPLAGDQTWTVLDGEAVPSTPVFLEVHPRAALALTAPGWQDKPAQL